MTNTSKRGPARAVKSESRASFSAALIFFLLFSGPPSLRLRSPEDSLDGVIDLSAVIQVMVWVMAGIWTVWQIRKELKGEPLKLNAPIKWGLAMVFCLSLSVFVSDAPSFTAFKVGQMLVSLLFSWLFVKRYGMAKCIDYVFLGSTLLCLAIAVSAFLAPDLVLFRDMDGSMRLRGDPIAVMGIVGTYSTILLFTRRNTTSKIVFWPLLIILAALLAFSLTRQAWFLVLAFIAFYLARRSRGAFVKATAVLSVIAFPFVFFLYILPAIQEYRSVETIWSLTGRTDLWVYLVGVALIRSPWIGLGYYSASRVLGPDFNPGMGTAHSMLVEVFLGGGLISLIPCIVLCANLVRNAFRLMSKWRSDSDFICGTLFLVTLALALMGGDIAFGQIGIVFWTLAAAIGAVEFRPSSVLSDGRQARSAHLESTIPLRQVPFHR